MLWIKDVAAARRWLLTAPVTNAVATSPPPKTALNIAFTAPGLRRLGIPEPVIGGFSSEFLTGMAAPSRSRQLGDVEADSPDLWQWGKPGEEPHLVVMFFGEPDSYEAFIRQMKDSLWDRAFEPVGGEPLETCDLDGIEPFGFTDGISQPEVDWDSQRPVSHPAFDYTNWIAPGELLLGYPNEYGKFTDRRLLDATETDAELFAAADDEGMKDLGRNGTYLVMRHLEQDVRAFWSFLYRQAAGKSREPSPWRRR